ncbi:MAG: molybdopterin-guanine dinucleotide biosynthesis protein MobA [Aeromicrobium sp.]|nr:molybdopterin-guanine dinucleotide biosynthesis protein MobA [Aeromicrobium sp.]
MPHVVGLLLAAGSGERFGGPKALARTGAEPWVVTAARVLGSGGCDPVVVVVGAAADEVRALLVAEDVRVVEAAGWRSGLGASLRAGLEAVTEPEADAVLVHLVDLPDVGPDVVRRIVAQAGPDVLARATYAGRPGHPVLLGREHLTGVTDSLAGDRGAQAYLADREVTHIDCSDLANGRDVDEPGPMLGR